MPTLTVTTDLLERLGVRPAELEGKHQLEGDAKRALEPLLASRGFDIFGTVNVSPLRSKDGFVLTQ